ncbi:MAG: hypothetical protein WKF79_01105 [Nocardioides sp.]
MKHDEGAVRVEIDRDQLEVLLHYARIGDKAGSMRSWRTKFRRQYVCAGDEREPDCFRARRSTQPRTLSGTPRPGTSSRTCNEPVVQCWRLLSSFFPTS